MQNLIDYFYIIKNNFTVDECNNIIKNVELQNLFNDNGSMYPHRGDTKDEGLIADLQIKWNELENKYTEHVVSLSMISPNISGNTRPVFFKYNPGHGFDYHADHERIPFCKYQICRPLLSSVTLLNDTFKGGEFYMFNQKIDLEIGDTMIYPSMFLYPHKVTPVSDGVRYSMGVWFW